MPIAPVNNDGVVLYYEDSGAPSGPNLYNTLILVHGAGFHGATFQRLIPHAIEHDMRMVTVNLRDYPGSTPYSQEELDDLRGPSRRRQEQALCARALELGTFLRWFIQSESIPVIAGDPETGVTRGGVALVSWSAGNCQTIALLANADQLPQETRDILMTHLRSYVLYEPSLASTGGAAAPEGLRAIKATRDPSMSLGDLVSAFCLSASAYYPPFTFPSSINLVPVYAPRHALHSPENSAALDPKHTPTTSRITPEELADTVHAEVIDTDGSQSLLRILNPDIYLANVQKALLDRRFKVGDILEEVWPALRIHVIWCDMSAGDCIWASVLLYYRHAEAQPEFRRPLRLHKLEGANHFVHWEDPERFVKTLVDMI